MYKSEEFICLNKNKVDLFGFKLSLFFSFNLSQILSDYYLRIETHRCDSSAWSVSVWYVNITKNWNFNWKSITNNWASFWALFQNYPFHYPSFGPFGKQSSALMRWTAQKGLDVILLKKVGGKVTQSCKNPFPGFTLTKTY